MPKIFYHNITTGKVNQYIEELVESADSPSDDIFYTEAGNSLLIKLTNNKDLLEEFYSAYRAYHSEEDNL